jgi:hypothetical protein
MFQYLFLFQYSYGQIYPHQLTQTHIRQLNTSCKVFNLVLDCGIIPESWSSGIIKPVYKNKGNPSDPDNFRAITLISCVGKLFTSILNSRLSFFAND